MVVKPYRCARATCSQLKTARGRRGLFSRPQFPFAGRPAIQTFVFLQEQTAQRLASDADALGCLALKMGDRVSAT